MPSSSASNSKTSSASGSIDTALVQDKEDEPETKKRKVYKFQRAWLKEFEWLEWDSQKELMRCRYCKAFPTHGSSSLVNGCSNLKHETLIKHSKSKSHVYCRDCYLTRSGKSKAATRQEALPEVLARQETAQRADLQRALEIKFNVAYTIAKEELPFTKFRPLLLLHKKNGVDISPTYDNDVKWAEFISSICESMKSDLCDRLLKPTRYASIIIDGDTDISIKECELVYVRILENGKPVNRLVGQQEVEHADAAGDSFMYIHLNDLGDLISIVKSRSGFNPGCADCVSPAIK